MEHKVSEVPDGVTPEEMALATELAFFQVQQYIGSRVPLARRDEVLYRSPDGTMHMGPLVVINNDEASTVLIKGSLHGHDGKVELRVRRSEVVRVADARDFVHRFLTDAHPNSPFVPKKVPQKPN